ncbi:MAG: fluoride efflux transporter CrcB [Lentisphaerae bacterium]|nr:fluoride efflux transporter CrcB [Lentisphaerota bacterium]
MPKLLLIGLGGCCGALARFLIADLAHRWIASAFPIGTLAVNILGCCAMGAVMGLINDKGVLGPSAQWLIVIGFLGSFTTFSALGYETLALFNESQLLLAALNAVGNYVLGIGAVLLGRLIVHATMA